MEEKKDYGKTLNLPKTKFKMKAKLPTREPNFIKMWEEKDIYKKSLENKEKTFILHDGPPYANGDIHIGHVLNKILKDIILKYKRLTGYNSPYIPGWDTHGLPIENKVRDKVGVRKFEELGEIEIRDKCTKHAKKFIEKQKKDFIRLGILGEWENPYITLNPQYEAKQLEVFAELWDKGYVFKGLKPVYWSTQSQTSLAESDIVYKPHVSPSIYVKFEAKDDFKGKFNLDLNEDEKVYVVIWTTTPWTLPGNVAISVHPELRYCFVKTDKGVLVLEKDLVEKALGDMEISEYEIIKEVEGSEFENLNCKHPFLGRDSLMILGDHVTTEAGTGCVHTAPGHGQEDYVVGTRYKLPVLCPVNNKGIMTEDAGEFAGLYYAKANKAIVKKLDETGYLLKMRELEHSYPHSDRDKAPVIFRATEQWFVKVEEGDIREKALEALKDVEFYPEWGRNRIQSMIESRPDWCISRQRTWGVPIPIFYDERNGKEVVSKDIILKVAEKVREEGSVAWIKHTPEELLGDLKDKLDIDPKYLIKDQNIMDVWFDSGVSHSAVLEVRDNLKWPADMYLEGSDQHRGWFQTSLLTSVGTKDTAPYKNILTHGFVVDGKGHKMSKSVGNVVKPQEVIDKYGADILRLWCASVDYRVDVRISENIIKQMSEAYRRIRNTARYILGNTYDFSYKNDKVEYENMLEIDKWALHKLEELKRGVTENYEKYEFYNLFHDIHYFAAVDMSSFYLDILKDRLYTTKQDSIERRSAQTAMYIILIDIIKMISPVLSFSAEEIWQNIPEDERETDSIHLASWVEENSKFINKDIEEKWNKLYTLKSNVNKFLEEARKEKIIGHSLNAKVKIYFEDEKMQEFIKNNSDTLEDLFIVSGIEILDSKDSLINSSEDENLYVKIEKADGEKCERCWKYSTEIGTDEEHSTICPRCLSVIK